MAAGENGGAGGGAVGGGRVEAVEAQTGSGHLVEDGCFEIRMSVIAGLAPALVVGHDEDDVGALRGKRKGEKES